MQIKCRPSELEVKFVCRFRSDHASLSLEEIVGEDIFVITEWTDVKGETLYYYKGLDSAEKAYREKREELQLQDSSDFEKLLWHNKRNKENEKV